MSLTSILSGKNNQILRDKFKTDFLRPNFDFKTEIKAYPKTKNWGIVGTAFDYLMRFYLEYHNNGVTIVKDRWNAEFAYKALNQRLTNSTQKEIKVGSHHDKSYKTKDLSKIINRQFELAKVNYSTFISNGIINDSLIESTIFLAKLDSFFRVKIIDENFDFQNPEDVEDLRSMIELIDKNNFKAKSKCYINPTFGIASTLVGGADADLIIDKTLIDIKTTKYLKLEREQLNQIIGYYILSLIGGLNDNPNDQPIEKIGIYFARYGVLWTTSIVEFGNKRKL